MDSERQKIPIQCPKKRSKRAAPNADKLSEQNAHKKKGSSFKKQSQSTAAGFELAQFSSCLPGSIECEQRPESSDEGSDEDSFIPDNAWGSEEKTTQCVLESGKVNCKTDEASSRASNKEKLKQHDTVKRMEANRLRAMAARKKKKIMIEEMNSKNLGLIMENERLKNQNRAQQTEIVFLRNAVGLLPMPNSEHQFNSLGLPSLQELLYHSQPPRDSILNHNNGTTMPPNSDAAPNPLSSAALAEQNSSLVTSLSAASPYLAQQFFQPFGGQGSQPLTQAINRLDFHNTISGPQCNSNTFLSSTAGSEGAHTSSSQRGPNDPQTDFLSSILRQGEVQRRLQQAAALPDDQQNRRDRLLLELLVEKHSN